MVFRRLMLRIYEHTYRRHTLIYDDGPAIRSWPGADARQIWAMARGEYILIIFVYLHRRSFYCVFRRFFFRPDRP